MWKSIRGYESLYEVSDDGLVRRLKGFWCQRTRPVKLQISNSGHIRVSLFRGGVRNGSKKLVHRLVYEAFNGPIPNGLTVNHCNGKKQDNRRSNLELATMSEQMKHAFAIGLQKRAKGEARTNVAKLTNAQVLEIRRRYKWRKVTGPMLAQEFGVSKGCVLAIVNRLRWNHI